MSFRSRLTFFFVLIVVVTMVAVGVVVFRLIADSQAGKADAREAAFVAQASQRYGDAVRRARFAASGIGHDPKVTRALVRGETSALTRRGRQLLRRERLARLAIVRNGRVVLDIGNRRAIAAAEATLTGAVSGRITVAELDPQSFARALTAPGAGVVVRHGAAVVARTVPGTGRLVLPARGTVRLGRTTYRVFSFPPAGPDRIFVLSDSRNTGGAIGGKRVVAIGLLVGFLLLALLFAILVSRALQGQIGRFLHAAQRLGGGDFSTPVPTEGRDDFAALGHEFNKMSEQLERRLAELRQERERLQESIRRIGQTFASNLDRRALLELGTQTAADAVRADHARARTREADGSLGEGAHVGDPAEFDALLEAPEARVLETGHAEDASHGDAHVLSMPLGSRDAERGIRGVLSVARRGEPFSDDERELLSSLAGQATLSIENASLHEQVQRQAVTDELTGLSNHRRFQEVMDGELERGRRFGHRVGLLMLDVDNFKSVNDTYGHQQGDVVLREVARVLRESSREIDEPARYGGEEMAVALPETDLEGAFNLAERVRAAVEGLRVPRLDGVGELRVTASLGVAATEDASKQQLIEAADRALYEAKRSGKNRTVRGSVEPAGVAHAE